MSPAYLHLTVGRMPPTIEPPTPYRAVVVLNQATPDDWQNEVSDWLVATGCLYMMAWGPNSSSWDDSVDWANLAKFEYAGNSANHPTVELSHVIIVDISPHARETEMLKAYSEAQEQT